MLLRKVFASLQFVASMHYPQDDGADTSGIRTLDATERSGAGIIPYGLAYHEQTSFPLDGRETTSSLEEMFSCRFPA